jgi:HlyD family secretion protein
MMGENGTGYSGVLPPSGGGTTGGSSRGGGGSSGGFGGRGGGEFMLVLQEVAPSGSRVKKGDTVAEFDRQYMLTRLDDYQSSVNQTESSFQRMKADLDVTKKNHDQTILVAEAELEKAKLDLRTTPVRSDIDAERLRLALEEAEARLKQLKQEVRFVDIGIKADLRRAEIELQQAQIELKRAQMNADRMMIKTPIDGLVVMENTFRGSEFDQIKQGDQLFPGSRFMQIVEPGSMVINANVNQVDAEKLRIGQRAMVQFDAFPGLRLPAKIYAMGTVAKASRSRPDYVKEMAVVLKLEQMDPRVIPDLSVSADVEMESEEAESIVPREALFQDDARSGHFVFVRSGNQWQRRKVELGLTSNVKAAVKGVRAGEQVALEKPPSSSSQKT